MLVMSVGLEVTLKTHTQTATTTTNRHLVVCAPLISRHNVESLLMGLGASPLDSVPAPVLGHIAGVAGGHDDAHLHDVALHTGARGNVFEHHGVLVDAGGPLQREVLVPLLAVAGKLLHRAALSVVRHVPARVTVGEETNTRYK